MKAEVTLPDELTREIIEGVTEGLRRLLTGTVTRDAVPEILDKKTLAAYLKVSESTVSKLVSNKQIPCFKVAPGQSGSVRFHKRDVDKWIARHTVPDVNDGREKDRASLRALRREG